MGHGVIFAVEPGGLFGHFHFGHEFIEHVDIVFKLDSDSTDVILLINKFGFIENGIELGAPYFIAGMAIDGDKVIIIVDRNG